MPATATSTGAGRRQRLRAPALSEADRQREAERLMARVRGGAALLYALVGSVKPGDSALLTIVLGAVLAVMAGFGFVETRERREAPRKVGILFAACDTAIFFGVLANNLDNPSDAVYIAGLLPVLEGALRWAKPGGLAVGAAVGAVIAWWTAAVAWRAGETPVSEAMAVRFGAMILVGWAVGAIVRGLQDQQLALQHALDASHDAMVTVAGDGRITSANDPCAALLGYEPDALIGARFTDLLFPDPQDAARHRHLDNVHEPVVTEVLYARPNGTVGWLEVQFTPVERLGMAFAVCRDVTVRSEAARQLDHAANHDVLTDLPNRRKLLQLIDRAVRTRDGEPALLFVDLDGFKAVNDTNGHDAGDELLRLVARRMQTCVRGDDVVARLAGDEFCVLLDAESEAAGPIAGRIVRELGTPFAVGGDLVCVAASVGVVVHRAGEPPEDFLKRADRTMYGAKQAGGNRALSDGNDNDPVQTIESRS